MHRDQYDDWTFPKGKCDPDETDEACAVREVEEETGLRCRSETSFRRRTYRDARGRPKRVRYWRLDVAGGELAFDHEVDQASWVTPAEAEELLTYPRDLAVLRAVAQRRPAEPDAALCWAWPRARQAAVPSRLRSPRPRRVRLETAAESPFQPEREPRSERVASQPCLSATVARR